jgi:hypothetical protein
LLLADAMHGLAGYPRQQRGVFTCTPGDSLPKIPKDAPLVNIG